jgi:hypothetical protein
MHLCLQFLLYRHLSGLPATPNEGAPQGRWFGGELPSLHFEGELFEIDYRQPRRIDACVRPVRCVERAIPSIYFFEPAFFLATPAFYPLFFAKIGLPGSPSRKFTGPTFELDPKLLGGSCSTSRHANVSHSTYIGQPFARSRTRSGSPLCQPIRDPRVRCKATDFPSQVFSKRW